MTTWVLLCGAASGALLLVAQCDRRLAWLAWLALTPLASVVLTLPPLWAACAGIISGPLACGYVIWRRFPRQFVVMLGVAHGVLWGLGSALAAWLTARLPGPGILVAFPLGVLLALLPLRLLGAPRWLANPLAVTQEPYLSMVHMAALGHDLVIPCLLALCGAHIAQWVTPLLSSHGAPPSLLGTTLPTVALLGSAVLFGHIRHRSSLQLPAANLRVRVAAAVSAPLEGNPHYMEQRLALFRQGYGPLVAEAARQKVQLLVLPEAAVHIDASTREAWLQTLVEWAETSAVTLVAGAYDHQEQRNELVIIDNKGRQVATYEKQHPGPFEPPRQQRMSPGLFCAAANDMPPIHAVICVDLGYQDFIPQVRHVGGILVAPANDWPALAELHHRTTVWAAALTGLPVVRATSNGISSVFDGSGREIAKRSSDAGAGLLIAEVQARPLRV